MHQNLATSLQRSLNSPLESVLRYTAHHRLSDRRSQRESASKNYLFTIVSILRWSINGPLSGKRCIHIAVPTKPSQEAWNQTFLCWPLDVHYKFKWLTHAPSEEEKNTCMKLTEPRDPTWNDSRYYLCGSKDQRPISRLIHDEQRNSFLCGPQQH